MTRGHDYMNAMSHKEQRIFISKYYRHKVQILKSLAEQLDEEYENLRSFIKKTQKPSLYWTNLINKHEMKLKDEIKQNKWIKVYKFFSGNNHNVMFLLLLSFLYCALSRIFGSMTEEEIGLFAAGIWFPAIAYAFFFGVISIFTGRAISRIALKYGVLRSEVKYLASI